MKALTQPERQEIVQILVHRKEVKLAALQASDPGWKQRIEERKNKVALGRLRVEKEACELKLIETQIRDLENRKAAKVMAIHAEFDAAKAQLAMCNTREDIVARKVL